MKPYLISKNFDLQRLFDSAEKAVFDSNNLAMYVQDPAPSIPENYGIGVLADAISCKVSYELNGQDELTMTYPITGQLFEQIELRALIIAEVGQRGNQPYRIYRITKPLNGIVMIYARHLAYDLAGIVVEPFVASNIVDALAGLKSHAMTINPFTFVTTRTTNARFRVAKPDSVWALMGGQEGSLLDVYGGEYTFDGYTVRLENRVGADNGVSVRYGVNMTDLEQDANCADCYTGVVAYWQKEDDVVYSPVISAIGTYGYVKILTVDMSDRWGDKPTVEQLTQAAQIYITANQIGIPKVSWKVGFVPLDMTEEYKDIAVLERVGMGDTVTVKFEKLGVDATSRVRAIEWDVLLDRYVSVSLGSIKSNIADTIAKQASELEKVPTTKKVQDIAARISTVLTNTILGAEGGSVRFLDTDGDGEPDTLYIADNPEPALATKVWRFNYEGWGASSNGYDGPFVMGATLDDGLLANFVTAANLVAGTIRSADGTTFNLDLDNGTLSIGGYASKAELASNGGTTINGGNITTGSMSADRIYGGTMRLGGQNNVGGVIDLYDENGNYFGKIYSSGIYIARDGYSSFFSGSSISFRNANSTSLVRIYATTDGKGSIAVNSDNGSSLVNIASIDETDSSESGIINVCNYNGTTRQINASIRGSGHIECKSLFINGNNVNWAGIGTGIVSGTNILILPPGRYYCANASTAQGLTNCPTNTNFALFVSDRNLDSNRKNYFIHDGNNNIYINSQTGANAWSGWKKVTTTSV